MLKPPKDILLLREQLIKSKAYGNDSLLKDILLSVIDELERHRKFLNTKKLEDYDDE